MDCVRTYWALQGLWFCGRVKSTVARCSGQQIVVVTMSHVQITIRMLEAKIIKRLIYLSPVPLPGVSLSTSPETKINIRSSLSLDESQ